jgi:hypothetical protein
VRRGNENLKERKSLSGLSNGSPYLVEGCMIDVTPEGLRSLHPKGLEGRLIPLEPS